MKKTLKPLFYLSVLIFCMCSNIYASIDNNRYDINMLCLGDAGDYCDALTVNADEFIFGESESNFYIEDSPVIGLGSYEDNGFIIEADFTAIDLSLSKYEFEITALNFLDFMLLGTMEITYSEWNLKGFSWDKKEVATAIFFGFVD